MASMFQDQALAAVTEQLFVGKIDEYRRSLSPFFKKHVQNTADGVSSTAFSLGRGVGTSPYTDFWVVNKHFVKGLAGYVHFRPMVDDNEDAIMSKGTPTANTTLFAFGQTLYNKLGSPGPNLTVAPTFHEYQIALDRMEGSFDFPVEIKRAAQMGAAKAKFYDEIVKRTAMHQVLYECLAWWCHTESIPTTTYTGANAGSLESVLARLADASISSFTHNAAVEVTLQTGSIRRFHVGQAVTLLFLDHSADTLTQENWDATGSPADNGYPLRVIAVNPYKNTITLLNRRNDGGTGADCSVTWAANDRIFLVPFNCHPAFTNKQTNAVVTLAANNTVIESAMPYGIDRFIKTTGSLLGLPTSTGISTTAAATGISLSTHPEYRSYIMDMNNQAVDEVTFGEFHGLASYAHEEEMHIDTWVGGEHFWSGIVQNLQGYFTYERQGQPINPKLGIDNNPYSEGLELNWLGKKYMIMVDSWASKGTAYGLVCRNQNFKRYVPPRLPGAGSQGGFQEVEFLAPARGYSSIFEPVRHSTNATGVDAVTAPFRKPYQIVPDVLPGVKLENVGGNLAEFA